MIKIPKLMVSKFSGEEQYAGLGSGFKRWTFNFFGALEMAEMQSQFTWGERLKVNKLGEHMEPNSVAAAFFQVNVWTWWATKPALYYAFDHMYQAFKITISHQQAAVLFVKKKDKSRSRNQHLLYLIALCHESGFHEHLIVENIVKYAVPHLKIAIMVCHQLDCTDYIIHALELVARAQEIEDDIKAAKKHRDNLQQKHMELNAECQLIQKSIMLSGKSLRRGLQRVLRARQQMQCYTIAAEKAENIVTSSSRRRQADGLDCWKCHHATDCCSFFCKACDAIQPINKSCHCDYFEIFNIPKNFTLEKHSIEKKYWNLQKQLHPDLYGSKSKFEKELSAVNASVVNDAYTTLKTPNKRVKYLLSLHGIDALGETASTAVDPELLMQTMEIRERIAEAPDVDALHEIRKEISDRIDAVIKKLGEVYDKDQDLESTEQHAVQLQYMVKCVEEIDMREEKLDG